MKKVIEPLVKAFTLLEPNQDKRDISDAMTYIDQALVILERKKTPLKSNDLDSILETIWIALEGYRENCIPEGNSDYDEEWGEICTAMAWIEEDLKKYHTQESENA